MKRPVKPHVLVLGGIALAVLVLLVYVAHIGGVFRTIETRFAGTCSVVPLGGSSEDIQIDSERGVAYLSVLNRASVARGEAGTSTLMLFDLNLAEPAPRAVAAHWRNQLLVGALPDPKVLTCKMNP